MESFVVAHAHFFSVFLMVLGVASVLLPALKASLPEQFKKDHPKISGDIAALADLTVNLFGFLTKVIGSRVAPPTTSADQPTIIVNEEPK